MKQILLFIIMVVIPLATDAANPDHDNTFPGQVTINVIGDSYVQNHKRPFLESWHYLMAQQMGMKYNNYGKNGACIAFDRTHDGKYNFGPAIYTKTKQMDSAADFVIIIAGHNDACKIGSDKDSLRMFRDSLQLMIRNIRRDCPKAKIGYVTPWYVERNGFSQVCDVIRKVCRKNNIPVLDNYSPDCVIKVRDEEFRKKYFQGVNDNAHLNANGHKLFLTVAKEWFNSVMKASEGVCVAPFYGNKKAAVSLTYDDGLLEHYTLVAPELEKRGFRGSFWIVGSIVGEQDTPHGARLTWQQISDMEKRGHEMGSHTWSHPQCKKVGYKAFMEDVERSDSAFLCNLGHKPMTLAYPYNVKTDSVVAAVNEGRIGSRLFQTGHGQQNNKQTIVKMTQWMQQLIDKGEWGITMTHGINDGYDKWYHPEELWQFYDTLKANEQHLWVAPFQEVQAYQRERDCTFLKVRKEGKSIVVTPYCSLDPTVFHQPITILIQTKKGIRTVEFTPGRESQDIRIK